MRAPNHRTQCPGRLLRPIAMTMAIVLVLVSMPLGAVRAALVSTDQAIGVSAVSSQRDRIATFLEREDVRDRLVMLGVDPAEAAARVAGLSDDEVAEIAGHLDQLPSGEGAIGAIIGAAVLIFLVLLVTDLLGLTHVFPFVHR